jgi:hypothetical protein
MLSPGRLSPVTTQQKPVLTHGPGHGIANLKIFAVGQRRIIGAEAKLAVGGHSRRIYPFVDHAAAKYPRRCGWYCSGEWYRRKVPVAPVILYKVRWGRLAG